MLGLLGLFVVGVSLLIMALAVALAALYMAGVCVVWSAKKAYRWWLYRPLRR